MKLLLIGCGDMASAMVEQWLNDNVITQITTVSPSGKTSFAGNPKVVSYKSITEVKDDDFDQIWYMAKPHTVKEILTEYKHLNHIPLLTVAAGVTIADYKSAFGQDSKIIRTMPNTACAVGNGVTPALTIDELSDAEKSGIEKLLNSLGKTGWLKNEDEMHAVTALSGSGVAYVYHFINCLAKSGVAMGLDEDLALEWAKETVYGGAKYSKQSPLDIETLRVNVTTPNGTTEQAMNVLLGEDGLENLLKKATQSAYNRSIEMGKEYNN